MGRYGVYNGWYGPMVTRYTGPMVTRYIGGLSQLPEVKVGKDWYFGLCEYYSKLQIRWDAYTSICRSVAVPSDLQLAVYT